jgi:CBS domain-containing protein
MLKLRDIMTRELLTLSPELSVREAIESLLTRRVSGAAVVSGGEVVGVVSATDLLTFAASATVSERFSAPDEPEDIDDVVAEQSYRRSASAYFTELWDDEVTDVASRFDTDSGEGLSALDTGTVADAMSGPTVYALAPDVAVDAAAAYMRDAQVHRVLVMDGPSLEGIVTTTDIANAVADHKLTNRTYVFGPARHFDNRQ